jgi:predicted nucleic acid-binding Zn ribbon protein
MADNVTDNSRNCCICGKAYFPTSNRQKYCSKECQSVVEKEQQHKKYVRTYVKKGYNQRAENNNNWKGGINRDYYQRVALTGKQKRCERCGGTRNVVTHHKDRDRYNNKSYNLELLCRKCHTAEHKLNERNFEPYRELTTAMLHESNKRNRARCQKV